MKNIYSFFAILVVIVGIGISQVFACKSPAFGLIGQQKAQLNSKATSTPSVLAAKPAAAQDMNERGYNARDLNGPYSSYAAATLFDPTANRTEYAVCVGLIKFDGNGHFVDKEVHSYDGVLVTDQFTGTYIIRPDGSGTMHYVGDSETYDAHFVLSGAATKVTLLVLLDVPGLVSWGTMEKQ